MTSAGGNSNLQRDILFAFSLFTVLTVSGVFLGFGPWAGKVSNTSDFNDVCESSMSDTACKNRKNEIMQYIFNAGFQSTSVASVIVGFAQDHFGPRVCGIGGTLVATAGNLIMAFASWRGSGWIFILIAYVCIGGGGIGPYLSSFHIAALYKSGRIVISTICGVFNLAGCVYILFSVLDVTRKQYFIGMGIVSAVCCLGCALLYPSAQYMPGATCQLPIVKMFRGSEAYSPLTVNTPTNYTTDPENGSEQQSPAKPAENGLLVHAKTGRFVLVCFWYSFICLWVSYLGGALPQRFTDLGDGDGKGIWPANIFNNWFFPFLGNASWVFAPIIGYGMERWGFPIPIVLTNVSTAICTGCFLINNLSAQIATLLMYGAAKAFLFGVSFAYLAGAFPGPIFGSLVALMTALSAIIGLSSFGIVSFDTRVLGGSPTWIAIGLVVLNLPTVWLGVVARNKDRANKSEKLIPDD